ncbi:P-loop containing nucleoside triphosphate hydrolase protein [Hypoxylon rubiginosum]|uniref:P-loop containing nucleoside triphosphate hydrolase protein n=1 Tax=Hypoxylon rubiginosum TaxID=110542 RepID=A0ACC0D0Y1_9PEZI|nr:P-loop containing nucleoside triphosphate hydrolase protein [Hypoxylon rubiginosum]
MNPNQPEQPEMSIMTYIDEPTWLVGPNQEVILTANFPLTDPNGYLGQKKKAAFVVVKTYTPDQQVSALQKACREKRALPRPKPSYEGIRLISGGMIEAAENFFRRQQKFDTDFPNFNVRKAIGAPYLCWYFYRSEDAFSGMRPDHRRYMELLTGEMEKSCGDMYRKINSQLERQVVSPQTIEFLFRPGDVLLSKEDGKQEGFVALGQAIPKEGQQKLPGKIEDWSGRANNDDVQKNYTWTIDAWSYQYDGHFYKAEHTQATSLKIHLNVSHYEKEVPMSDLNLLPLAYAEKAFAERLAERGRIFWSCRRKKLVSYQETLDQFSSGTGERFMVDYLTYTQLHPGSTSITRLLSSNRNYMDENTMRNDSPPSAPEIYLFPDTIPGYNLRTKKWVDLDIDRIRSVKWNKVAFEHLVIEPETKEIIQALVTNQSETDHDADMIESKGNGLIMLLHGGPGTGKTFTAETVAEIAEKPLFRVTCGDIGTKPEEVEKYLESALNLGKIWECVVLLDEADVFLEQRTLTDLERNALVSVFLRVLEYYEGIMILTSNRVGTFDEAFKSRIQLSLHYENLNKSRRRKIWKNFLDRLSDLQEKRTSNKEDFGIDFEDINDHLQELSNYELNGRQIRNAITTARQLAKFKRETMSYAHLKHVINVASKFDTYLEKLNGFSSDDIARENGLR